MRFLMHEKGQGLVEYALIFMLIAVIIVVLLYLLGPSVGNMYSQVVPGL